MILHNKMVLVTGGTGWLGRRFVEVLRNRLPDFLPYQAPGSSLKIRCFVFPSPPEQSSHMVSEEVEVTTGDLRDKAACRRFCEGATGATLFHIGGIIHPKRISDFYSVNVDGTVNLLEAAAEARVKRVVIVSSNSVCGNNPRLDHQFDAGSPYNPYMNYGRSKMLMELAVERFRNLGTMETVIIRAPWFYGPGQPLRQTLFFRMIRDGSVPIVGSGENRRSMAYIDNLCHGLLLAGAHEKAAGQVYWIADRQPYSMNEIVNTIEHLLETEFDVKCAHKRLRLPNLASTLAEHLDRTIQAIGFYNQKVHVLSEMNKTIACSISKAEQELGYSPTVALEEGMRRSIQWLLETYKGV